MYHKNAKKYFESPFYAVFRTFFADFSSQVSNSGGEDISFSELERQALAASPFKSFINPDSSEFFHAGDIPLRICEYCKSTNQPVPTTKGEIMRCIYESLALKYRYTKEKIEIQVAKTYDSINVVGGGIKDGLLSQFTANATGVKVIAGPAEAAALGNIAVQLIAAGKIRNIKEARKIIANSTPLQIYIPTETENWNSAYEKFIEIIKKPL